MHSNFIKASVLALSLISGSSAFADHKYTHGPAWLCGDNITHLFSMNKSLKLNAEQTSQVNLIREQLRSSVRSKYARMLELRTQIQKEITSEHMSAIRLDQLINQKAQLIGDFMRARAIAHHQVYLILSPQQKIVAQKTMLKQNAKKDSMYAQCIK